MVVEAARCAADTARRTTDFITACILQNAGVLTFRKYGQLMLAAPIRQRGGPRADAWGCCDSAPIRYRNLFNWSGGDSDHLPGWTNGETRVGLGFVAGG